MNRSVTLGVGLLLVVLIGIALIDAGAKRPVDWTPTYDQRDKIPFGLFVLHTELPAMLGTKKKYADTEVSFYEEVSNLNSLKKFDWAIIDVLDYGSYAEEESKPLLEFVHKGGELFIASAYLNDWLLDTLDIAQDEIRPDIFFPTDKTVTYSLGLEDERIQLEKVTSFMIFSKLNSKTSKILGNVHTRGRSLPNFVQIKFGKGSFYLHSTPLVFTNYHMLSEKGYTYATKALNVITKNHVLWSDNYYASMESSSPLRVMLGHSGFKQAWYLLLFGLVLLLIFKSRRTQRAVKVVHPEPNLSKEFAKTIGNLYYENGNPGNVIGKKIDYFLFAVRAHYQLETTDLQDDKFCRQLALRAGMDVEEVRLFLRSLEMYQRKSNYTTQDVKVVNEIIEDFKNKANIL